MMTENFLCLNWCHRFTSVKMTAFLDK